MHVTAKIQGYKTYEIQREFCETQSFWRTIHHPDPWWLQFKNGTER